jgi:uncharacterized protein (DUF2237 family)
MEINAKNVLGGPLEACSYSPLTGFFRDGCCHTGMDDVGSHVVCAVMTEEFLHFSLKRGNDLITPRPEYRFKGLQPGDRWCLCVTPLAGSLSFWSGSSCGVTKHSCASTLGGYSGSVERACVLIQCVRRLL